MCSSDLSLNTVVVNDAISTFGGSFSNSASNQVYMNANSNIFTNAGSDITTTAGGSLSNSAVNVYTAASGALSNTAASLGNKVTGDAISTFGGSLSNAASNNVYTNSLQSVFTTATASLSNSANTIYNLSTAATVNSAGSLSNYSGDTIYNYASQSFSNVAGGDMVNYASGTLSNYAGGDLYVQSIGSTVIQSGNNVSIFANGNPNFGIIMDTACNTITLKAPGGVSVGGGTSDSVQNTNASYIFNVKNSPIWVVDSNGGTLYGNLDVQGTLNTINISETDLYVSDKVITLASASNGQAPVVDGLFTNSGAGIVVNGLPTGVTDSNNPQYAKSFLWNYGSDGLGLDKSHALTEPAWQLDGGSFHLTLNKPSGAVVTYALRINQRDELEFVKVTKTSADDTNPIVKLVSKFGYSGATV